MVCLTEEDRLKNKKLANKCLLNFDLIDSYEISLSIIVFELHLILNDLMLTRTGIRNDILLFNFQIITRIQCMTFVKVLSSSVANDLGLVIDSN
jgi:hypothetical protein